MSSQSSSRSLRFRKGGLFLLGVLVILAPVAVRNNLLGGGCAPTTSQFGPNFYIGNHAGADGLYHPLVPGQETPAFERADATRLAEEADGRPLSSREVSRYWAERTWRDIRSDPVAWLVLMGRKLLMVLNDYEVADAEGMIVYADASEVLGKIRIVGRFGILFPLSVVGVFLYRRSWRAHWIAWAMVVSMVGAVALFFVLGRYRFPLVHLLVPFAVAGCVRLIDRVKSGQWREVFGAMGVGAVATIISHWPVYDVRRLDAMARMNAGVALAQRGDLTDALGYFERAVQGYPESPEANANLAQALAQVGEATGDLRYFERAVEHYGRAIDGEAALPGVHFNLGVALERLGRLARARRAYERALEIDPGDAEVRRALDRLR